VSLRHDPVRRLAFDTKRFHADLIAIVKQRGLSEHKFSFEVGVNNATLSHMRTRGSVPDGVNLAALAKWSGLNPADYSIDRETA
jgi:hypothetical protein